MTDADSRGRSLLTSDMILHPIAEQVFASESSVVDPLHEEYSVWNRDKSDVFYKPEDGVYGIRNRIMPGQAINDPVDGIATSYHRDQVFKIPGKKGFYPAATVYEGGSVSLKFSQKSALGLTGKYVSYYYENRTAYHYGWMTENQLDPSWSPLFRAAALIR